MKEEMMNDAIDDAMEDEDDEEERYFTADFPFCFIYAYCHGDTQYFKLILLGTRNTLFSDAFLNIT